MAKLGIAEIYENGATLRDKVTYGADGVDDDVLARAEAAIAGLSEDYLVWAENDIQSIEQQCAAALALPEDEQAHSIQELYNTVHGMKGQGGSFGFPLMTRIADSLGRFIENLPLCGHREMDVINVHLNAMRMVLAEHLTDGGGQAGERMLLGLDHVIEKFNRH